jgi:hypothetical protein
MKRSLTLTVLALALAVGAACTATSTAKPIPQAGKIDTPVTVAPAALAAAKKDTGNIVPQATTTAPATVSSCDVAREALLTGTPAQVAAAMRGLIADRAADGTAREYADYYLHRDATDPGMRSMDIGLIRMSCS